MSSSSWPHWPQHTRLPCASQSPGVYSNSRPLSHPTISSSVDPFSSCPQSFPASGSFPMSQLFTSGGQSIGASASISVLPMNIQDWCPLGLIDLTSLLSKGLSRVFSSTIICLWQIQVLLFFWSFLEFCEEYSVCGWMNWWVWNPQIWEADCM